MHTLVIEGVIEFAECLLVGVATIKRSVVFARHKVNRWDFQCADNVFELRHAVFADLHVVGCVGRSPVKTMKSGCTSRLFTSCTAFFSMPSASELTFGPSKSQ